MKTPSEIQKKLQALKSQLKGLQEICLTEHGHHFRFVEMLSVDNGKGGFIKDVLITMRFCCSLCDFSVRVTINNSGLTTDRGVLRGNDLWQFGVAQVAELRARAEEYPHLVFHPFQKSLSYQVYHKEVIPSFTPEQMEDSLSKAVERAKEEARIKLQEEHARKMKALV